MKREEFDILSIIEQLNFINGELQNGKTLRKICEEVGVGRTTVRDRADKAGYGYNKDLNRYVVYDNSHKNVIRKNVTTKPAISKSKDTGATTVMKSIESVDDRLVKLAKYSEEIMDMLEWFKVNDKRHAGIEPGIKIELPKEKIVDFRTTIRVNDVVWKEFKRFCVSHSEFTQKDLLSQALFEFMDKHK